MTTRAWSAALIVLVVGCGSPFKSEYDVYLKADPGQEEFKAPSVTVYAMICDAAHPEPDLGSPQKIRKWFKDGMKVGTSDFKDLGTRTARVAVEPNKTYKLTVEPGEVSGEEAYLVVVARMGTYTKAHAKTVRLLDDKKRDRYTFILTPSEIKVYTSEQEEAAEDKEDDEPAKKEEPETKKEPEKKDDTADKAADAATDEGEKAATDEAKKKVGP